MKKVLNSLILLLSTFLIFISIENITGMGVQNGECTFYQTISPFGKYFHLTLSDKIPFAWISIILFAVGLLLLYVPNFLLFERAKIKSTILIVINTVSLIIVFTLFKSYQYLFMMIVVCILMTLNILLQHIENYKTKLNLFLLVVVSMISFTNIHFLFNHYTMIDMFNIWYFNNAQDRMIEEMTKISKLNILFFALWFIPCIMLIIKELKNNCFNKIEK